MNLLLFKTSSLGDLIHCFPALTDAQRQVPGLQVDWVVEEAFAQVPAWHPAVRQVLPIGLRRWRRNWRLAWQSGELRRWHQTVRSRRYDLVLDAQGLLKSALPARLAIGPKAGYDHSSIREPLAALLYQRRFRVSRSQHAIDRNRLLMAQALGYQVPPDSLDYGLRPPPSAPKQHPYLVLLHATTWPSKHWPEAHWVGLARLALDAGLLPIWPWHGESERLIARRMQQASGGELTPQLDLDALAALLAGAAGVVGVDSGLSHLAAALDRPGVALYGSTAPGLTGVLGRRFANLSSGRDCAPCLERRCRFTSEPGLLNPCLDDLEPRQVWQQLQRQMDALGAVSFPASQG
jgi:heptosyltransferase-1